MQKHNEIKITVTQEHIDEGIACSCYSCPIALAIKALGYTSIIVMTRGCTVKNPQNEKPLYFSFSQVVSQFIKNFDTNKVVVPFSFIATEEETYDSIFENL